jgi:hypothetical protein
VRPRRLEDISHPLARADRAISLSRILVLRIHGGSLDRLWVAVEPAQSDWRDTLVGAGFGHDPTAHLKGLAD